MGAGEERQGILGILRIHPGQGDPAHGHLVLMVMVVLLDVVRQLGQSLRGDGQLDGHGLGVVIVALEHEREE